jgi:hypothetical protein
MSPEEWLASQTGSQSSPAILSPEEWLAQQEKPKGPIELPEEDTSSDFMRGITNYFPQTKELYGAAKVLTGNVVGSKELTKSGIETMEEAQTQQQVKKSDTFTDAWEKGIGTVVANYLPYQIGAGVANVGESLAMLGIGAGVGAIAGGGIGALPGAVTAGLSRSLAEKGVLEAAKAVAKNVAKEEAEKGAEAEAAKLAGEAAAKAYTEKEAAKVLTSAEGKKLISDAAVDVGKNAGLAGQAVFHGAGETAQQAIETGQEEAEKNKTVYDPNNLDLGRLLPAAAVHAVADFVSEKFFLSAFKEIPGSYDSFVKDVAKAIATTAGKELVPEEIQEMAQRYGANLSLTDADALKDYLNTAMASVAMSIVPGTVGGTRTYLNAKSPNTDQTNTETVDLKNNPKTDTGKLDADTAAVFTPATEATGQALVDNALVPEVEQPEVKDPKVEASNYLAELDAGNKKPNASILKGHLKALGIEDVETGKGFTTRAIDAIKNKVAEGEPNVEQPNAAPSGGSAEVVSGPAAVSPTEGTGGNERPGVVPNEPNVGGAPTGEIPSETSVNTQTVADQVGASTPSQTAQPNQPSTSNVVTPISEEQQLREAFEKDQQREELDQQEKDRLLEESYGKPIPQNRVTAELREEYEGTRQEMQEAGMPIPPWEKLTVDEKYIYLENIRNNTIEEHRNAGERLFEYREGNESTLTPAQRRIAIGYVANRGTYSEMFGTSLPAWDQLTPEAQQIYLDTVKNNSAIQQDQGFNNVMDQLEKEGTHVRGVGHAAQQTLLLKGTEQERKENVTKEAEAEKQRQESAQGKGKSVSEEVRAALIKGDINGVLDILIHDARGQNIGPQKNESPAIKELSRRQSILTKFVNRFLARALSSIKFTSKVVTDVNDAVIQRLLKEGKLAEYDPKTDTFYFTPGGFDESTILHEIVHAGTVKLINQYLTNPDSLEAHQREAIEHLQKIFDFAKKRLGARYKNAFENLYEFMSYSMTDNRFQNDLAGIQSRNLGLYTSSVVKDLWTNLTTALSKLYGLITSKGKSLEMQPELYAEMVKAYSFQEPVYKYDEEDGELLTDVGDIVEGQETEVKEEKKKYKNAKKLLSKEPGYEGNLLLELSEILDNILATPEVGTEVAPLAAKKAGAAPKAPRKPKQAKPVRGGGLYGDQPEYKKDAAGKPKTSKDVKDALTKPSFWRRAAVLFQNRAYEIKSWQNKNDLAGLTRYSKLDEINNISDLLTLAAARGKNYFNQYIQAPAERLEKAINQYAKTTGQSLEVTLQTVHRLLEALHEPERRMVRFLLDVPLSKVKNLMQNGVAISAADRRAQIINILDSRIPLTRAQAQQLRTELNNLVFERDANGNFVKDANGNFKVSKYVDPMGDSPKQKYNKQGVAKGVATDITDETYNVIGVDKAAIAQRLKEYQTDANKPLFDEMLSNLKQITDATILLNREANYFSNPVGNRVNFYNYQHYAPFKGFNSNTKTEQMLDFNSEHLGKDLQSAEAGFGGRSTLSNDPILQALADAARAAATAGRGEELTQAIKNASKKGKFNKNGQGLLDANVIDHIEYKDRENSHLFDKYSAARNIIFHYNSDGSIDIIKINENKMAEAIKKTYQDVNPMVDIANKATSFFGQLHTRYNYNFAPLNFVRDALTNAWAIGADMGPAQAAKFISIIATHVVNGGLPKAAKVAKLFEEGNFAELERLSKNDAQVRNMVENILEGGLVSHMQGLSMKSNFDYLNKQLGRNKVLQTKDQLDKVVDLWNNMFEIASRGAAYGVAKANYMSDGLSEQDAAVKAAVFSKNLANFEQVGKYGKAMGALFMFFRPSATGAVRAIEAAAPAFTDIDNEVMRLPAHIRDNPAAVAEFRKNFAKKQKYARIMTAGLFGLGMTVYAMSMMMAPDDDLGRNETMNDSMDQWTRYARFHLPGMETPIQMPWGFGLGAFAASGAQMAAFLTGKSSFGEMAANTFLQIALDSFVPIPVSRMSPVDNPVGFAVDSIAPSLVRPVIEFAMNKNGLGQDINNEAAGRKMGDAYIGGDHIPEIYKDITRGMFNTTDGEFDWSPNTLYFFANSYADGASRVGEELYSIKDLASGQKDFSAKTDLPFFGSFFGAKSNVDTKEFTSIERQIEEKTRILNEAKVADPEVYAARLAKYPFDEMIIGAYNNQLNANLNPLRAEAKQYKLMAISPKERDELLKVNKLQQDLVKYQMVSEFKAYGMRP